jgi:hypothetical protein
MLSNFAIDEGAATMLGMPLNKQKSEGIKIDNDC